MKHHKTNTCKLQVYVHMLYMYLVCMIVPSELFVSLIVGEYHFHKLFLYVHVKTNDKAEQQKYT